MTVNDHEFADFTLGVAGDVIGAEHVHRCPTRSWAPRTSATCCSACPGTMLFLGGTDRSRPAPRPRRTTPTCVVFDEDAMVDGVAIYSRMALRHLGLE